MSHFLGIDTSNYTTSVSLYNTDNNSIVMQKQLLAVKPNAVGLRQSDAVFEHIKQLHLLIDKLFSANHNITIDGVCASTRPRTVEGSYMPAFLVGDMVACSIASTMGIPKYSCSHQDGHIVAALYGANSLHLLKQPFYAFHLSGGTTEAVLVEPTQSLFATKLIAKTLDLNAGQLIDRVGVMLGLNFPCGVELTELALKCDEKIHTKPTLKGVDIHISGVQNQCEQLYNQGKPHSYIARYAIEYLKQAVDMMTEQIFIEHGKLPVLYAGGVMSNVIIKEHMQEKYNALFAPPQFSTDNAAGVSIIGALLNNN